MTILLKGAEKKVGKEFILGPVSGSLRTTEKKKNQQSRVTAEALPDDAPPFGKNRQLLYARAWMALPDAMLNKRSQTQESTNCVNPVI